ncbi:MAG: twin-arginine translocation signal domain-containing protein [Akkermansiaceae bacterium]|jgi:hypothetical protein|nr:twin-arginine translocation signal domain-containing protein [Akkermansiaceae bacterium]
MIPINRRQFLSKAGAAAALAGVRPHRASAAPEPPPLTAPGVIRERVRAARPLHGGPLPRKGK